MMPILKMLKVLNSVFSKTKSHEKFYSTIPSFLHQLFTSVNSSTFDNFQIKLYFLANIKRMLEKY